MFEKAQRLQTEGDAAKPTLLASSEAYLAAISALRLLERKSRVDDTDDAWLAVMEPPLTTDASASPVTWVTGGS